ncbi:MAG TPA: ester cyclase [Bryobacteraceae bacterium]
MTTTTGNWAGCFAAPRIRRSQRNDYSYRRIRSARNLVYPYTILRSCIIPLQRKALVQLYIEELMGLGRLGIADQILADDVHFFGPGSERPVRGREPFKEFVTILRKAFPDLSCEVHAVIEELDRVACWLTVYGTHRGSWRGHQPTGRRLALEAVNLFRFSGERINEVRAFFNVADYDTQLGKGADPASRIATSPLGR